MKYVIFFCCINFICISGNLSADLTDGLIAYYPFNGNANDESGNGNHGTVYNGTTLTNDRFGNLNCAYDFDGENDFIEITPQSTVSSIGDFTISVWTYLTNWKSHPPQWDYDRHYVFDGHSWSKTTTSDFYRAGFTITYDGYDDGSELIMDAIRYTKTGPTTKNEVEVSIKGAWHHHVFMRKNKLNRIYYDGNKIYEFETNKNDLLNMQHDWYIGTFSGNNPNYIPEYNNSFFGVIDDIRIYDRSLAESEVLQLFYIDLPYTLTVDTYTIPQMGGVANFTMIAGPDNANRSYILLGNLSGTSPGTSLPGGLVIMPINWDFFTNLVIRYINSSVFQNFLGQLDVNGIGAATLNLPYTGWAGTTLYFSYAMNNPWDFASNPVAIEIVP